MVSIKYLVIIILAFFVNDLYSQRYNIVDFGAVTDTTKLSTEAVQNAINSCNANGGGEVIIPAGSFKIGSVILKSNVTLFLEAGAILYGSPDINDYTKIKTSFISLRTQDSILQLIYAENCSNVGIRGYGEINGQGAGFIAAPGDEGITRPFLIRFIRCTDVRVENISLKNSPCWMQHYLACEKLNIKGLRIFNRSNLNNDAMDIDGCKDVVISDIISDTEDDGITLKSTSGWVTENVTITNCIVSSRWNAIKMGTESNGGFKNICISNCVLKSTKIFPWHDGITSTPLTGIALMITDGGILENIVISNIAIDNYKSPIYIRLGNRARPYLRGMPGSSIGRLSDISIDHVQITNGGKNGCSITGLPGYPLANIRLSNISMELTGGGTDEDAGRKIPEDPKGYPQADIWNPMPAFGFFVRHVNNVSFNNVELHTGTADARPAFYFDDAEAVTVRNSTISNISINAPLMKTINTKNIFITNNIFRGKANCLVQTVGLMNKGMFILNNYCGEWQKLFALILLVELQELFRKITSNKNTMQMRFFLDFITLAVSIGRPVHL